MHKQLSQLITSLPPNSPLLTTSPQCQGLAWHPFAHYNILIPLRVQSKKCQVQFNKRATITRSDRGNRRSLTPRLPIRSLISPRLPLGLAPLRNTLFPCPRTKPGNSPTPFLCYLGCSRRGEKIFTVLLPLPSASLNREGGGTP
jgi:hypothetical protein